MLYMLVVKFKEFLMVEQFKLNFGDSQDLEIFHQSSSSNCFIQNNTGNLRIINNTDDGDITFESDDGSGGVETYFYIDGSASKNVSNKDLRIIDEMGKIWYVNFSDVSYK